MIACLDSGNSRIKWGIHDGTRWCAQGAVPHAEVAQLAELPARFPVTRALYANVAGDAAGAALCQALATWSDRLLAVRSSARAGGVSNGYGRPGQLGVDRWCALIGARAHCPENACLVVMAGTATTVDTLTAAGKFRGGLILPGYQLMLRSLARDTAGLPFADGHATDFPTCTDDAIVSGCLAAQVGAIRLAFARLAEAAGARCLLSGGNAGRLLPHLNDLPCQPVDNLVLDGLAVLARA